MTVYKKLLVPVDGSELSDRAMTESVALARQLGTSLVAFVAEPATPLPAVGTHPSVFVREADAREAKTSTHAERVLARFASVAAAAEVGFEGRSALVEHVDTAIADEAERSGCDMIVMVTHGRGTFGELLFGSHTKGVLSRTALPVLVLR